MSVNPKLSVDAADVSGAIRDMVSSATGITAFATGGQANATQLTKAFNRVTTVATTADSVKLPVAVAGMTVVVKNAGANSMDVFPATGGTINALSANTALAVAAAASVMFVSTLAGAWDVV